MPMQQLLMLVIQVPLLEVQVSHDVEQLLELTKEILAHSLR
jgi:hypothetical protein